MQRKLEHRMELERNKYKRATARGYRNYRVSLTVSFRRPCMKSKAVLFQKEIRMETCWLILHSILVTHYWTALMGPAKKARRRHAVKSERERLVTNTKHNDSWEGKRRYAKYFWNRLLHAFSSFSCYRLSPFYLALVVLDFTRKSVFYVCRKLGQTNRYKAVSPLWQRNQTSVKHNTKMRHNNRWADYHTGITKGITGTPQQRNTHIDNEKLGQRFKLALRVKYPSDKDPSDGPVI